MTWSAPGEHDEQIRRVHQANDPQHNSGNDDGHQERQRDMAKLEPQVGAVHGRRFVELIRNPLERRQVEGEERKGAPHGDHKYGRQRRRGVGEERVVVSEHTETHKDVVDNTETRIEHKGPHVAGHHRR